MPVKYFVSQDSQGWEKPPNSSHVTLAIIDIIKQVYVAFHHHPNLYAMIVNLHKQSPMADLIAITEWGLGVVELRHDVGPISMRGVEWYAGSRPIPGDPDVGYRNPHEQVQIYAGTIRYRLLELPPHHTPWLPGKSADWEKFQFGTAVCFTNEGATFDRFPFWHYEKSSRNPHIKAWEQFSILKSAEIPGWVAALRFEVSKRYKRKFEPYHLTPDHIMRIVTELFGATEWTGIDELIVTIMNSIS